MEDDGLPRGSKVASHWKKNSGPGEVTFSDTSTAPVRVKFAAGGTYELAATDGEKSNSLKVTVRVADK